MTQHAFAVFDTDMQIHRFCEEPRVGAAADKLRFERKPVHAVAFSKVEFKGAYIQRLALLQNKVRDSDSIQEVFVRVKNSGGRGAQMMLAQLIRFLGRESLRGDWSDTKAILLTHLDAQIGEAWRWFSTNVDGEVDSAKCTRAKEGPTRIGNGWDVGIPNCRKQNTRCRVSQFFKGNTETLKHVIAILEKESSISDELQRILEIARDIVNTGVYKWEGTTCRTVGDLLIGLEAKDCRLFVTSNAKEHVLLSQGIGYPLEIFKNAILRLK
jgi:hypothetical protein